MKLRPAVLAVMVAASAVACGTPPRATAPTYSVTPEYCPYDDRLVQFNGDSVGASYAHRVRLPEYSVFNASQGGAGWVFDDVVATIPSRVRQWIDQCGVPGAVVIEGGINDLTHAVAVEEMQAEVRALSAWLAERDVPTVWLAIHPMPITGNYWFVQEQRLAYNEWLTTSGELWGATVDCTPALEAPDEPDSLRRSFWSYLDVWGTPDGNHMNADGYEAMARCVEPVVSEVLGPVDPTPAAASGSDGTP